MADTSVQPESERPPVELLVAESLRGGGVERPVARLLDPGWLFIIAGLGLLAAVVLIPAQRDLEEARFIRDRALQLEESRVERLRRHQEFLTALEEQQPALVMSLAASQLNRIPGDRAPVGGMPEQVRSSASVFPALEPPAVEPIRQRTVDSKLSRWATGETSRLWMIAGGAFLVLIGLLPGSVRRG